MLSDQQAVLWKMAFPRNLSGGKQPQELLDAERSHAEAPWSTVAGGGSVGRSRKLGRIVVKT